VGVDRLGDGFGKGYDSLCIYIAGKSKCGVAINSGVFKINTCTSVGANNDLEFIVPSIATSLLIIAYACATLVLG